MAASGSEKEKENSSPSPTEIPLIQTVQVERNSSSHLFQSLDRLETFLGVFGFCQYSFFTLILSWASFLLLGVALPIYMIYLSHCDDCEHFQIRRFEFQILAFQAFVAAISLLCISQSLRKYGIRKFLFVDRFRGSTGQFHDEYVEKIRGFFYLLVVWISPCLVLKIVREVVRMIHLHNDSWWQSIGIVLGLILSWTYSVVVFLSGCALFYLVCNLQVIHYENYGKLLERDLDVSACMEEHIRLTHYLSKISHRYRIFFILELLVVTASEFVAILQTTGNPGLINLINGGDFAISTLVEVVGLIICLYSAAKVTGRAQGVVSVASRWHSLVTCTSDEASSEPARNGNRFQLVSPQGLLPISYSESDLEAVDYIPPLTTTASYNKRQALVTYLQSNPGGFTLYGWVMDRPLINTIVFLEMSIILFVLGKTITLTTK